MVPELKYVEEQVAEPDPELTSVQAEGVNVPVPDVEKVTVPVGLEGLESRSLTVAEQSSPYPSTAGTGVHPTTVVVVTADAGPISISAGSVTALKDAPVT